MWWMLTGTQLQALFLQLVKVMEVQVFLYIKVLHIINFFLIGVYEFKDNGLDINEIPAAAGATCFSWSPKGKQIAVGSRDGKITQYKPDLKAVKIINAPPLPKVNSLISLQWVSNYQFIGVFQPPSESASIIVVDAPKSGEPVFINFDDICYSNGEARPSQFYMILQQTW